jgi:hypothetical protein
VACRSSSRPAAAREASRAKADRGWDRVHRAGETSEIRWSRASPTSASNRSVTIVVCQWAMPFAHGSVGIRTAVPRREVLEELDAGSLRRVPAEPSHRITTWSGEPRHFREGDLTQEYRMVTTRLPLLNRRTATFDSPTYGAPECAVMPTFLVPLMGWSHSDGGRRRPCCRPRQFAGCDAPGRRRPRRDSCASKTARWVSMSPLKIP